MLFLDTLRTPQNEHIYDIWEQLENSNNNAGMLILNKSHKIAYSTTTYGTGGVPVWNGFREEKLVCVSIDLTQESSAYF